ncbi:unnamed protein product, partial [Mesorhabditis belari]|uniref:Uncharacterized protein n=1 Tax=Mesorhabditis belari TaxID=2138241 RepID=A0AAF3F5R9_9BILA
MHQREKKQAELTDKIASNWEKIVVYDQKIATNNARIKELINANEECYAGKARCGENIQRMLEEVKILTPTIPVSMLNTPVKDGPKSSTMLEPQLITEELFQLNNFIDEERMEVSRNCTVKTRKLGDGQDVVQTKKPRFNPPRDEQIGHSWSFNTFARRLTGFPPFKPSTLQRQAEALESQARKEKQKEKDAKEKERKWKETSDEQELQRLANLPPFVVSADPRAMPGNFATWSLEEIQENALLKYALPMRKQTPVQQIKRAYPKAKLFDFFENVRPAYYGTWRKKLRDGVSGRRPYGKMKDIDYEIDSDQEWHQEVEDADECLSTEEFQEEDSETDEDLIGFRVPACHLSEGEGDSSCDSTLVRPKESKEMREQRLLNRAKAWEESIQKKKMTIAPNILGPSYDKAPPFCEHLEGGFNTSSSFTMPMSRQELEQVEQSLQRLKLQDLKHIIANLNRSKIGKKAELLERLTVLLRNPASQDRSFRVIREYQQLMTSNLMRTGYIPPVNPYAFGQQPGGGYPYGVQQQFPPKVVVGLHPVPLPFFDVIESIVQPTELPPAGAGHVKLPAKQTVTFTIPVQHANHLNYNSESRALPRYEIQLRFFHLGDNWQQKPQPDDFPLNCQVHLDELNVSLPPVIPTNRQNVEPKRPSRPVNLTPIIQNIGRVGTRQHRLVVDWTADRRAWAFSVNFVYRLNSEILIRRLKEKVNCVQPQNVTKQIIIRRLTTGDEDGICLEQIKASVKCPLTRTRLSTPIRCRDCDHLQCYDLENYIQMNEKKPTWKCPVCSHPAPYERLLIDEYFVKVLNETSKDVDEVELLRDGGWKVIFEEAFALSSDDDEDVKPAASTQANASTVKTERPSTDSGPPPAKKKCPPPNDDIITLDDSDDDDDDEIQRATEASLVKATRQKELNASTESANKEVGSTTISTSPAAQPSTSEVTAPNSIPTTPVRKNNGNSSSEIEIITLNGAPPRPVLLSAQNGVAAGTWRPDSNASASSSAVGSSSTPNPGENTANAGMIQPVLSMPQRKEKQAKLTDEIASNWKKIATYDGRIATINVRIKALMNASEECKARKAQCSENIQRLLEEVKILTPTIPVSMLNTPVKDGPKSSTMLEPQARLVTEELLQLNNFIDEERMEVSRNCTVKTRKLDDDQDVVQTKKPRFNPPRDEQIGHSWSFNTFARRLTGFPPFKPSTLQGQAEALESQARKEKQKEKDAKEKERKWKETSDEQELQRLANLPPFVVSADPRAMPGNFATWSLEEIQENALLKYALPMRKQTPVQQIKRAYPKAKLFDFFENVRPAYYGTWRKKLRDGVSGRRPYGKMKDIDYEIDSDQEWHQEVEDADECLSTEEFQEEDSETDEDLIG